MIENGCNYIARLTACGFSKPDARDVCMRYALHDDEPGLADFVRETELFFDDRREYV